MRFLLLASVKLNKMGYIICFPGELKVLTVLLSNFRFSLMEYSVGLGGECVTSSPRDVIVVPKISCGVAIFIWDIVVKAGGACHVFSTSVIMSDTMSGGFVGKAIKELIRKLAVDETSKARLRAKIVGGADIAGLSIGRELAGTVQMTLSREGIRIIAQDVGGVATRSAKFNLNDGSVAISYITGGTKVI